MTIKSEEVGEFEQPLRQIALRQEVTYQTLPADAMKKMNDTVRKVTWVEAKKPEKKPEEKKSAEVKKDPVPVPAPTPKPVKMNAMQEALAKSLKKKVQTQLKIEKDREEFLAKEKQRIAQLNQDKIESMKKIDEYEKDIKTFPEKQKKLIADLDKTKKENVALLKAMEDLL